MAAGAEMIPISQCFAQESIHGLAGPSLELPEVPHCGIQGVHLEFLLG